MPKSLLAVCLAALTACAGYQHWPQENSEDDTPIFQARLKLIGERWNHATVVSRGSPDFDQIARDAIEALMRDKQGDIDRAYVGEIRRLGPSTTMVAINWTIQDIPYPKGGPGARAVTWATYTQVMERGNGRWELFKRYFWGHGHAN